MENLLSQEQIAFLDILLFIVGTLCVVCLGTLLGTSLRPYQPNIQKLSSYESGEEPEQPAWVAFDIRFYGIGLVFMLFEVETILLFPWAMVCHSSELTQVGDLTWPYYANFIGTSFILILIIGLLYAYKHGHFKSDTRSPVNYPNTSQVPQEYYQKINHHYTTIADTNSAHTT
jgi:NADH-quinone oxidoreductase subunit A